MSTRRTTPPALGLCPGRVLRAGLPVILAILAVGGCATSGEMIDTETVRSTSVATAAPSSVPGPGEQDLAPGWDEQGDGAATPDAELTPGELTDMLRLPATAASTSTSCRPDAVDVSLTFLDAATGHRYGVLRVVNSSPAPCSVQGFPGIGARGAWGSVFQLAAEQRDPIDGAVEQDEVMLAPGASAVANVEWTGELSGSESEPMSLLVVQLTAGGEAIGHPVSNVGEVNPDTGTLGPDTGIDIGMMTTVRIGPLRESAEPVGADG